MQMRLAIEVQVGRIDHETAADVYEQIALNVGQGLTIRHWWLDPWRPAVSFEDGARTVRTSWRALAHVVVDNEKEQKR